MTKKEISEIPINSGISCSSRRKIYLRILRYSIISEMDAQTVIRYLLFERPDRSEALIDPDKIF